MSFTIIAVRGCDESNPNAIRWDEAKKGTLQLSSSAFSGAIYDKLEWMKKYKFRFRGVTWVREGERIIFFFLDEPQILVGKDKARLNSEDSADFAAKYIPYKESGGTADGGASPVAYPENWRDSFGVSYEIREKRTRLLDVIAAEDIRNAGAKMINPFIGAIPDYDELREEIDRLYQAM